jgi:hypothetical protein
MNATLGIDFREGGDMPCRMRCPSAEEGPSSAAAWPNRIASALTPSSSLLAGAAPSMASAMAKAMRVADRGRVMAALMGRGKNRQGR